MQHWRVRRSSSSGDPHGGDGQNNRKQGTRARSSSCNDRHASDDRDKKQLLSDESYYSEERSLSVHASDSASESPEPQSQSGGGNTITLTSNPLEEFYQERPRVELFDPADVVPRPPSPLRPTVLKPRRHDVPRPDPADRRRSMPNIT